MPTSNLPTNLSDRELLLVTLQQVAQLKGLVEESHHDMREQLARGNIRFEQIAQRHSDFDARIDRLVQPITRAGVEAQRALELALQAAARIKEIEAALYGDKDEDRVGLVQQVRASARTLDEYTFYFKVVGILFVLIQVLVVPIVLKFVMQWLGM